MLEKLTLEEMNDLETTWMNITNSTINSTVKWILMRHRRASKTILVAKTIMRTIDNNLLLIHTKQAVEMTLKALEVTKVRKKVSEETVRCISHQVNNMRILQLMSIKNQEIILMNEII